MQNWATMHMMFMKPDIVFDESKIMGKDKRKIKKFIDYIEMNTYQEQMIIKPKPVEHVDNFQMLENLIKRNLHFISKKIIVISIKQTKTIYLAGKPFTVDKETQAEDTQLVSKLKDTEKVSKLLVIFNRNLSKLLKIIKLSLST